MSTSNSLYPEGITSQHLDFLHRMRLNRNTDKTCEDVWKEEAQVLTSLRKKMKKPIVAAARGSTPFKAGTVDPSQLVEIRRRHQTKRAERSVRPSAEDCKEAEKTTAASQRHKICMQMADVIRRTGTGLERGLRWKSGGAPGARDPIEVSLLKGNSANAELAARERTKTVRT